MKYLARTLRPHARNVSGFTAHLSKASSFTRYYSTKTIPNPIFSMSPETALSVLLCHNAIVVVGEDHTDHAAKQLISAIMPFLKTMDISLAYELVQPHDPGTNEAPCVSQEMIDHYIFCGDNESNIRKAIEDYCHDYGNNMMEEIMALLKTARKHQVRVLGVDKICPEDHLARIENANTRWEKVIRGYQALGMERILMLVGKYHLHNVNLYDEQAGDQAEGIDHRLGSPSVVVHTAEDPCVWKGASGLPQADVEIRVPAGYFLIREPQPTPLPLPFKLRLSFEGYKEDLRAKAGQCL